MMVSAKNKNKVASPSTMASLMTKLIWHYIVNIVYEEH